MIEDFEEGQSGDEECDGWAVLLGVCFIVYVIVSIACVAIGMSDANYGGCQKTYRADYVLPARKLGCWLGKETEESKSNRNKYE